jgi:hypothetical protein
MSDFDDKYLDVLQNIEFALMQAYRAHAEMTDWEAREAVKALMRVYKAEASKSIAPILRLNLLGQEAFESVKMVCDWRLGKATVMPEDGKPSIEMKMQTLDEVIACLQRILRSIQMWEKEGGRRGYFNFVSQFVK